jgi:hypothetical protein
MSQSRSEAARINGAKSKGPITPEGRARSSRNSLRHGLLAEHVLLPHEDKAHYDQVRDSYIESFQPADQPQLDLVETIAAARWRLNRLVGMEATIFEKEMVLHDEDMVKELAGMTKVEELAWVFDHMANHGKGLQLLLRYEGQLNRTYDRALKQLQSLQKTHPPDSEVQVPNEPKLALVPAPSGQPNQPKGPENAPPEAETLPSPSDFPESEPPKPASGPISGETEAK